jgi:hypothetical protein
MRERLSDKQGLSSRWAPYSAILAALYSTAENRASTLDSGRRDAIATELFGRAAASSVRELSDAVTRLTRRRGAATPVPWPMVRTTRPGSTLEGWGRRRKAPLPTDMLAEARCGKP